MLALIAIVLICAFPVVAGRAVRRSRHALVLSALVTLFLIAGAAAALAAQYHVPSLARLMLYCLALAGPVVIVPTVLLALRPAGAWTAPTAYGIALLGALTGGACGWLIVVYWLRVW